MRAEDDAAAGVVRCAARALAGAAGALLAIRLGAAAADLAAGLGVGGAGAATGQLGDDGLVQHGLVDRRREQRLGQVDRAGLGAGLGVERRGGHRLGLPDQDERVARAGHRALDEQQVALGVGAHDGRLLDGDAVVAHVAGHAAFP